MSKVKIQGNASGSGVFTLTTPNTSTDRTITLPDASGTLAFTTDDDDKLPLAGGTMTGTTSHGDNIVSKWGTSGDLEINHDGAHSNIVDSGTGDLRIRADNLRLSRSSDAELYLYATTDAGVQIYHNGSEKIKTTATGVTVTGGAVMGGTIVGSGTSNTVGAASALRLGESNFRIMTGGESHVLCLDRDNNGGTKKIMQSWNPDNGTVAIGSAAPVAAGMLMIKPTSLTQAQIKLQGLNYSFGAEIMSQNGSESGTVGNTRCWYKLDLVTQGNVRRMYTASSQIGTDYQYFSTQNVKRMSIKSDGRVLSQSNVGFWVRFNGTGTIAIADSYNVTSVADWGTGNYGIYIASGFANANYCATATTNDGRLITIGTGNTQPQGGRIDVITEDASSGSGSDRSIVNVSAIGDMTL